jgi:hypothetical protein
MVFETLVGVVAGFWNVIVQGPVKLLGLLLLEGLVDINMTPKKIGNCG